MVKVLKLKEITLQQTIVNLFIAGVFGHSLGVLYTVSHAANIVPVLELTLAYVILITVVIEYNRFALSYPYRDTSRGWARFAINIFLVILTAMLFNFVSNPLFPTLFLIMIFMIFAFRTGYYIITRQEYRGKGARLIISTKIESTMFATIALAIMMVVHTAYPIYLPEVINVSLKESIFLITGITIIIWYMKRNWENDRKYTV